MTAQTKRLILGLVVGLGIVLAGYAVYQSLVFKISRTDPAMGAVATRSPFVKIYFNQKIDPSSLKLTDYGDLFSSTKVDDKVITLTFARGLTKDKSYAFSISHVESQSGKIIENKRFDFTAKDIPINKLSKDQQAAILAQQDQIPYSVYAINYDNFDALTEQGISSVQLQDIKSALLYYSKKVGEEYWTITLDPKSLVIVLHDSSARDSNASSATFRIDLAGQRFSVRAEYNGLQDKTYTRIYAPDGSRVFNNATDFSG
jgi:hypothetical protein